MSDEATGPGSDLSLHVESAATTKILITPDHDTSIAVKCVNVIHVKKRKCGRKGRRKSGTKKHRAGKNQKRRYKPYHRLSFSERQKVDDRNEKRNTRKREYYHSCGLSLAPPNTNQFLFQDRPETDLFLRKFEGNGRNFDHSDPSSQSDGYGTDSESDDFQVMWKREIRQRFQDKTDQELREYYMDLEDRIAEKERKREEEMTKIQIFQEEVRNYDNANEVLFKLNAGLAKALEDMHSKVEKESEKKDMHLENDSSADTV